MNLTSTLTGNGWDVYETTGGTPVIQRNGQVQPGDGYEAMFDI